MTRLISYADEQERKVSDLQNTVSRLQHALESRVVIDRAVGILSERFDLEIADAFELLRAAARDSPQEVRTLATQLAEFRHRTPDEIAKAARARRIVDQP